MNESVDESPAVQRQESEDHGWLLWIIIVLVVAVVVLVILYYVVKVQSVVNYINKLFHKDEKDDKDTDCAGAWGAWGACSSSCGGGTQERTYAVTTPKSGNGAACAEPDGAAQTQECNAAPCGIQCGDGNTTVSLSFFDLNGLPPQPTIDDLRKCPYPRMYSLCSDTTQQTGACIYNSPSQKLTAGLPLVTPDNQTIDTVQSCTPSCDGNDEA